MSFIIDEGTGCVDNGCSKGITGKDTLEVYKNRWRATGGVPVDFEIQRDPSYTTFAYGNDDTERSNASVWLPAWIGG